MRLAFTPLAEQDLEAIADYIAADNPVRALSFVRELRAQCQRITLNPPGYRLRPELGDASDPAPTAITSSSSNRIPTWW